MRLRRFVIIGFSILCVLSMIGCSVVESFSPTATPTQTPLPTLTPTPTITPTATEIPYYLTATVWAGELQVPILIYHRFVADDTLEASTSTKMRYSDFKNELQALYENGFSLISLQDWMDGTFVLPEGKKPLIITMDDFWFADQIFIEEDGTPSINSGIGILWAFYQEHPDFGFSVSVFSNMGDKKTADIHDTRFGEGYFIVSEGDAWMDKLGQTIVWAIEHGVDPYNHLYTHPQLSKTDNAGILFELKENDRVTRWYLSRIGREDLIPQLGNMISLPYGEWPLTSTGIDILKNYKTPEDKPVQAIFEAYNLAYDEQEMTASIFSSNFDPYKMARIMATVASVNWVIEQKDTIPTAATCQLGPLQEEQAQDRNLIQNLIMTAVANQTCPEGVYNVNGNVFVAKDGGISQFYDTNSALVIEEPTSTPTSGQ